MQIYYLFQTVYTKSNMTYIDYVWTFCFCDKIRIEYVSLNLASQTG